MLFTDTVTQLARVNTTVNLLQEIFKNCPKCIKLKPGRGLQFKLSTKDDDGVHLMYQVIVAAYMTKYFYRLF